MASLPSLCRQLCAGGSGPGFDLARWLVMEEWTRIVQQWEQVRTHPHATTRLDAVCGLSTPMLALLESSLIANTPDLHAEMLRVLTSPDTEYPIRGLLHLLRTAHETRTGKGLRDLGLAALREHCVQALATLLRMPVREKTTGRSLRRAGVPAGSVGHSLAFSRLQIKHGSNGRSPKTRGRTSIRYWTRTTCP